MNGMLMCLLWLTTGANNGVITNQFDPNEQAPKLKTESVWLYVPEKNWTYSHHPSLTFFRGHFYAMWSNGRQDEDAPGQRVLYCSSRNFQKWTTPRPLLGPVQGKHSELVLTAAGFYPHAETLTAYVGQYEYAAEHLEQGKRKMGDAAHQDTRLVAMTSQNGTHWSVPRDLEIPIVPNHPPQPLKSGRLIISGNISFPYTDDPAGLTGWTMAGIYPAEMAQEVFDDSEGFHKVQQRAGWSVGLCEGSFYQTDDQVVHMLLRSGTQKLWVTESSDNGTHWSSPRETAFMDDVAKFHCGRLPDGRFYQVGNSVPNGKRNPLVLSLSKDGIRFDRHFILMDQEQIMKHPGLYKGGVYAYPHTLVHDGYLYTIVSIYKESVLVLRTALKDLPPAPPVLP